MRLCASGCTTVPRPGLPRTAGHKSNRKQEEEAHMKKHLTRLFAGALCCALALSLLPGTALAAEGPEAVYQGDGYYITVTEYGNQDIVLESNPFSDGLIAFYSRESSG